MTHPENQPPRWNESQVERLLEDFYQQEMPPSLREESPQLPALPAVNRVSASPSRLMLPSKRRANSLAGVMMFGVASLLLVMTAMLFRSDTSTDSGKRVIQSQPKTPEDHAPSITETVPAHLDPGKAFDHNSQGPIELQPRLPQVGIGEPEDRLNFNPKFPELDIEIFPLDQRPAPAEKPNSAKPQLPESQPRGTVTPMPEENRTLPESQLRKDPDPDEAALEPILPELRAQPALPLAI